MTISSWLRTEYIFISHRIFSLQAAKLEYRTEEGYLPRFVGKYPPYGAIVICNGGLCQGREGSIQ